MYMMGDWIFPLEDPQTTLLYNFNIIELIGLIRLAYTFSVAYSSHPLP